MHNKYKERIEKKLLQEALKLTSSLNVSEIVTPQLKHELDQSLSDLFKFDNVIFDNITKEIDKLYIYPPQSIEALNLKQAIEYYHNNHLLSDKDYQFYYQWVQSNQANKVLSDFRLWLDNMIEQQYEIRYFKIFDAIRSRFINELQEKLEYLHSQKQASQQMQDLFGRFWDIAPSELKRIDVNLIQQLYQTLQDKKFINQIAELLGRLANNYKTFGDVNIKELIFKPSNKQSFYSPENLHAVKFGNDIASLLKYQLAFRNKDKTEKLFKLQYLESKLLHYEQYAKLLDESITNRKDRGLIQDSKGPFILCIDTSGSMHGEPEIIAKALSLALTKIAREQNRKCYVISFSTDLIEYDATDLKKDFKAFYDFLSMSFQGGTDIVLAIDRAVVKCKENDYRNADIIVISDFIINELTDRLRLEVEKLKRNSVRFNALSIGKSQVENNIRYFDHNWIYDGTQASIDNIIKNLNEITRKR